MASYDQTTFYKVVLVGDAAVGKTSLRLRYLGEGFRKEYMSTLGADFAVKTHKDTQIQIWDLSGQMNFRLIIKGYFQGAHGVIVVCDVTRRETLENITNWIDEFLEINGELVPTIILANKIDLRDDEIESIETDELVRFVEKISKIYKYNFQYLETSALSGQNIDLGFEKLIYEISLLANE
jgi:small GTP-binding protein